MQKKILCVASVVLSLMAGCSSEQSTKEFSPDSTAATLLPTVLQPPTSFTSTPEPLADNVFVSNDSLIALQLEQARQHYIAAMSAQERGDSTTTTLRFEQSLQILNELSYFPEIESNSDFTDLSNTVVEDYERYIRRTGNIDATSSIFALREKLNQISDLVDTAAVSLAPKRVITGTTIPLVVNNLVEQHINFFTGRGRHHMESYIERSGKYFPMMRKIMREEGVPEEIVYLAMVESGLNPLARSWAKAVGIWQFIKGTGSMYDLKGNFWYDERRDFEKATRAAARHLKDLYEDFEDWYLVMAAYNSGPGNVYRGMRRSGSSDFWEMRSHLPRETRNYVPSFIAVAIIGMNPSEYGFGEIVPADSLEYDYVTVNDCVDLDVLAECAGTSPETLRELNPELLHRATPPSREYRLRVPMTTDKEVFARKYAAVPEERKGYLLTHVVRRGDTLPKLARRYGLSQTVLADANDINPRKSLRRGSTILIPISRGGSAISRLASNSTIESESRSSSVRSQARVIRTNVNANADRTKIYYKVKSGDTIGHIAEWFGVRATDVRNWNNLPYGRKIRIGATLNLWVDKQSAAELQRLNNMSLAEKSSRTKKTERRAAEDAGDEAFSYVVKSGDSLDKIAQEHGVTIRQIQRWNSLRSSRINPGKKLVLYPRVREVDSRQAKTVADAKAQSQGKTKQLIYVVRRGDTISEIAQAHDVRESELRLWNSLSRRSRIYAGQELIIRKDAN